MEFIFIGDANGHGPEVVELFGYTFPKGVSVAVDDNKAVAKLSSNGHFQAQEKQAKAGNPLESMTKDELEELGREHGIELDKRKSVTKLINEVQEAIDAN